MILLTLLLSQSIAATNISSVATKTATLAVREIFAVFVPGKASANRTFVVKKCDDKPIRWLGLAFMKQGFDASYRFANKCDVQGKFSPKMDVPFPVDFELRHLEKFNRVKFNLTITAAPSGDGVKYRLSAVEGVLSSSEETVKFHGHYFLLVNPYKKQAVESNEGGEITVESVNDKPINQTSQIFID